MKRGLIALLLVLGILPGTALAARHTSGSATLQVTFTSASTLTASSDPVPYLVSGCGYDASLGGVTVVVHSPVAISFAGGLPDANGCISVSNFSTQGSGHYDVDAYQTVKNRSRLMASTSFDL